MKFENWLQKKPERYVCSSGSRYVDIKTPHMNDDGTIDLEVTGKTCLYDEIQSYADSVDINVIMARYAQGDMSVLSQKAAMFMDVSEAPKTFAEAFNMIMKGEQFFNELPIDIKEKFDNNFYKFVLGIGSEEYKEAFDIKTENSVEESVVKENE